MIWSSTATGNTSHYNSLGDKVISESVTLQKDKYYYMELYQSKSYQSYYYKYVDYLQISVEIPNPDDDVVGNVFAVHKFSTSFDPDPEIL